MRKIKDVLRLCWGQGLSKRQVARSCGMSRPAVNAYLRRAEAAGLRWPLPVELDDGALERGARGQVAQCTIERGQSKKFKTTPPIPALQPNGNS